MMQSEPALQSVYFHACILFYFYFILKSGHLDVTDNLKSGEERQQEKQLMQRLMEIVNGRNVIVEVLDEDRRRY